MEFISIVEIIGTIAFAMSGALTAIEKDLDYYGIGIFAITTSVGGGIVRDLLIDRPLPASLENPLYALISLLSAGFRSFNTKCKLIIFLIFCIFVGFCL